MERTRENLVDALAEALVLRILEAEFAPGEKLPSVRALADSCEVNVSTIQRVLARLEEMRVVRAEPRSGVVVLDPQRHGGSALWPVVLRHAAKHRTLACAVLRDALAARRTLAVEVVQALFAAPRDRYVQALTASIAAFAAAVVARPEDLRVIAECESEIVRTVLLASERPAVLAIYNDIAATLMTSELVLSALCGEAVESVPAWQALASMLTSGSEPAQFAYIEPLLRHHDDAVVARFARALGAERAQPPGGRTKDIGRVRAVARRKTARRPA